MEEKYDNGLSYIIKYNEIFPRTITTLIQSPKLFFSAFFWMAFADLSIFLGYNDRSSLYSLLTGIGDFVGVIIGGVLIIVVFQYSGKDFYTELHNTIHIAICSGIVAGSLWQVTINWSVDQNMNFNESFWLVTSFSFSSFFVSMVLLRFLNQYLPYQLCIKNVNGLSVYNDFLLAISLGVADGFFVGTESTDFPDDDWLIAFGISEVTPEFTGMCLAGSVVLCGFLLAQTVQNIFLSETWVDGDKKTEILFRSASSLFGSQTELNNETVRLVPLGEDNDDVGGTVE